jgi:DNA modification methylase
MWVYWPDGELNAEKMLQMYCDGNEQEQKTVVEILYQYYRRIGYPHRCFSREEKNRQMSLIQKSPTPLLADNYLQQNNVGVSLANSFHPQMLTATYDRELSPLRAFNNDTKLKDILNRLLELNRKPTPANVRKMIKTRDGVRSVQNFKPVIARFIYENFVDTNGVVLDPCAGYGGRLVGAIATNKNLHYIGIDPEGTTVTNNTRIAAFFKEQLIGLESEQMFKFHYSCHLGCAEDIMCDLPPHSVDLVFTSPPYFNIERYSEHPDQSYKRYELYEDWKEHFLTVVICQAQRLLKTNGHCIINVKDYPRFKIASDVLSIAQKIGFNHICTYNMKMPNKEYRITPNDVWHTEPIYVFRV